MALFLLAPKIFWGQDIPQEPEDQSSDKSLIQKAKDLVKEFNEQKEVEQESGPVNAVQFLGDFLTDKLPLTLDLGAEPGESGSLIFGSLQYDWKDRFASRIRLEYKNDTQVTDVLNGYQKSNSKNYSALLYPAIWYFGDTRSDSKEALWSLGAGVGYDFFDSTINYCYAANSYLLCAAIGMNYHALAPIFLATVKKPLGRFFGIGAELYAQAVTWLFVDIDLKSNSDAGAFSYSTHCWSSPAFSQTIWLDVLKYVRIKASFKYSRLSLEAASFDRQSKNFVLYDAVDNEFQVRGGVELVLPSTNKTRKKDSHLWAGVYYQHTWSVQEARGQTSCSDKGKWVVCFGK